MHAQIYLLNGFAKSLWYKVPDALADRITVGALVKVPLRGRTESAYVAELKGYCPLGAGILVKEIIDLESMPDDKQYSAFINLLADYYMTSHVYFYQRIGHFLHEKQIAPDIVPDVVCDTHVPINLTDEQKVIVDNVAPLIISPLYQPIVIHGVTGSGKTEVYKKLIEQTISQGKTVVLLLPEVTLALQFEYLLAQQMSGIIVSGFHSAIAPAQKRKVWQDLVQGVPCLLIGVHLPIVLPIANLGLIIIDEEHEQGFREKRAPYLHSKEIALWRAFVCKIPIILGSATPSLTSLYNVEHKGWKLYTLTKRFAGAFPVIEKVILSDKEGKRRKHFWISDALRVAIQETLERKEQVMLFINRRGYSFFVQCKGCGFIFQCERCSVSLTLHVGGSGEQTLRCHYCDHAIRLPVSCPACKAGEKSLLKKGVGTQQVVSIVQELFPNAIIERADLDTTKKKHSWKQTVINFKEGRIDILIGTQTITKGYDFPSVTLVGILWADLNLHFPVYNASETTLQQLIQVAGRAGRHKPGSMVIVQTMHDHPVYDFLDEKKYVSFCKQELEDRECVQYPPFVRLACIELRHKNAEVVQQDAMMLAHRLRDEAVRLGLSVRVLGPAFPLVSRVADVEIRHIILKAPSHQALAGLLALGQKQKIKSSLFCIVSQ